MEANCFVYRDARHKVWYAREEKGKLAIRPVDHPVPDFLELNVDDIYVCRSRASKTTAGGVAFDLIRIFALTENGDTTTVSRCIHRNMGDMLFKQYVVDNQPRGN